MANLVIVLLSITSIFTIGAQMAGAAAPPETAQMAGAAAAPPEGAQMAGAAVPPEGAPLKV